MNRSKWKVSSNYVNGVGKMYGVYRLLDANGVDHSGNRETTSGLLNDKEAAQLLANELNEKEVHNEPIKNY